MKNILEVSSSGRIDDSVSRQLSKELLGKKAFLVGDESATLDRARASIAELVQLHDAA